MSASYQAGPHRVRFAASTDVGRKRSHNEDNFHLPGEERLAIVADGMGGHAAGEVASKLAVDTLVDYFRATAAEPQPTWPFKMDHGLRWSQNRLVAGIKLANAQIWEAAQKTPKQQGMGTTIATVLFLDDGKALIAHAGDSRVYRLRQGELSLITDDHSLLNDYMRLKGLRADQVTDFPQKHVIVRALGMKETVQVDVIVEQPRGGDVYVLCSDGLSGMVSEREIAQTIQDAPDLDEAVRRLVAAANEHGGVDNITVVLARVEAGDD